ncbi:MFS transporter [Patescibacteria group bacterium]|nr:MFS transporter [Patescibacteria group bacterium]
MLILSDVLVICAFGLVSPIFAVYVTEQIEDGGVEVIGIAATIFLLVRSLGQLPIAGLIDKIKGELDDYWLLVIGSILTSFVPLLYILATTPTHLYLIGVIYGILAAFTLPTWYAIFTRHVDHNREGIEWSLYTTLTDVSAAAAAAIGGYIAATLGFNTLFVVVSAVALFGSLMLIFMHKDMRKARKLF